VTSLMSEKVEDLTEGSRKEIVSPRDAWTPVRQDPASKSSLFDAERPLPLITVRRYAKAAVRIALSKQREDGAWYLEVPILPGAWAEGPTLEAASDELEDVVFEWALLKIEDQDKDFPRLHGIDLNQI